MKFLMMTAHYLTCTIAVEIWKEVRLDNNTNNGKVEFYYYLRYHRITVYAKKVIQEHMNTDRTP